MLAALKRMWSFMPLWRRRTFMNQFIDQLQGIAEAGLD